MTPHTKESTSLIPALRYHWLTRFYDAVMRVTMRDASFKKRLIEEAAIEDGHRVLDLGCGTGTLTVRVKHRHPGALVVGLDGDANALTLAKNAAQQIDCAVVLTKAMCWDVPFPDESFDRVLSSLVFHHLTRENKLATLREVFRVLRPGGRFHIVDWGKPANLLMRLAFYQIQVFDGFKTTADSVQGALPGLLQRAGFIDVRETRRTNTAFGTLSHHTAQRLVGGFA